MVGGKNLVCRVCKRRFASRTALQQHSRAAHAGGKSARVSVPTRSKSVRMRSVPKGNIMSQSTTTGTDLVKTFSVSSADKQGKSLLNKPINPSSILGTRMQLESALWQRWRPVKLRVRVVGASPTTIGGAIAVAWSPDPTINITQDKNFLTLVLGQERSSVMRLDGNLSFDVPVEAAHKWYLTGEDPAESSHGSLICCLVAPPVAFTGSVLFSVVLDWTFQWEARRIDMSFDNKTMLIEPDSGYVDIFTSSDGSFDAEVLTFKAHAGGSMVPFSDALPGVVYRPAGKTKVQYYDTANVLHECKHFSLVVGYQVKGLVLHDSNTSAINYQRTGSKEYCLKWQKNGPLATPSTPIFEREPTVLALDDGPGPDPTDRVTALEEAVKALTSKISELGFWEMIDKSVGKNPLE